VKSTATIDIVGFAEIAQGNSPLVGIIANPVSARDIRRVIANASSLRRRDRVGGCTMDYLPHRGALACYRFEY